MLHKNIYKNKCLLGKKGGNAVKSRKVIFTNIAETAPPSELQGDIRFITFNIY